MKRIACLLLLAGFMAMPLQLMSTIRSTESLKAEKQVALKGKLKGSRPAKSLPVTEQLLVFQDNNGLTVYFLENLGTLNITVKDAQGTEVYNRSIRADSGAQLRISTLTWDDGDYYIYIADAWGGYMEGGFSIES